jgi:hypothetical protein
MTSKTWPFGSGHRALRGWLMSQDPTLDVMRLAGSVYRVTDKVRFESHLVVMDSEGGSICSCTDDMRFRPVSRREGRFEAHCAHVWMVRFRRGDHPGAEPPAGMRKQGIRGSARSARGVR